MIKPFDLFHQTSKSGPNGQALWSSVLDLSVLPKSLVGSLTCLGDAVFNSKLTLLLKYLKLILQLFPQHQKRPLELRRLSYFPDRENKVRVVAILDYFSQSILRPFHSSLFSVLRRIRQDCTFKQSAFVNKLRPPKPGESY